MTTRHRLRLAVLAIAIFAMIACGDSATEPATRPTLLGPWVILENAQIWGVDEGMFWFEENGAATIQGLIYGEPNPLSRTGTWTGDEPLANTHLTFDGEVTRWEVRFLQGEVLFLETNGDLRWFLLIRPLAD